MYVAKTDHFWKSVKYMGSNEEKSNITIKQKGMTQIHDFVYSFPLFSSLLKKRGKKRRRMNRKIVILSHAFLLDQYCYRSFFFTFWVHQYKFLP